MPQWYMIRFTEFMPDLHGKVAIRPLPAWEPGGRRLAMGGGTGTAITDQINPDHLQIAMEFLEYAKLTYEANVLIWTEFGFDPFRHDVFSDPRLRDLMPYFNNEVVFDVILDVYDELAPQYLSPDLPRDQLGYSQHRLLCRDGGKPRRSGYGAQKCCGTSSSSCWKASSGNRVRADCPGISAGRSRSSKKAEVTMDAAGEMVDREGGPVSLFAAVSYDFRGLSGLPHDLRDRDQFYHFAVSAERQFVGLDNYVRLFNNPQFYQALENTTYYTVATAPHPDPDPLDFRALLNSKLTKFAGVYQSAMFMPALTSLVIVGVVFRLLLDERGGLVNAALASIGIAPQKWLNSVGLVIPPFDPGVLALGGNQLDLLFVRFDHDPARTVRSGGNRRGDGHPPVLAHYLAASQAGDRVCAHHLDDRGIPTLYGSVCAVAQGGDARKRRAHLGIGPLSGGVSFV